MSLVSRESLVARDDLYAWIVFIIGILLVGLGIGDVLEFDLTIGSVTIKGPAGLGSILVILSTFRILRIM